MATQEQFDRAVLLIRDLHQCTVDLLPGAAHIAVRDFGFLNETLIDAGCFLSVHDQERPAQEA